MKTNPIMTARQLLIVSFALALSACSSSAAAGPGGHPQLQCNTGTFQQLASPTAGQTALPTNIGQVIIVASGNQNVLYNTYTQWQTTLIDNFGLPTTGGPLKLVPFPSGPHPYPSDFYYGSSLPLLMAGRTFTVYLTMTNGSCSVIPLSSFST